MLCWMGRPFLSTGTDEVDPATVEEVEPAVELPGAVDDVATVVMLGLEAYAGDYSGLESEA